MPPMLPAVSSADDIGNGPGDRFVSVRSRKTRNVGFQLSEDVVQQATVPAPSHEIRGILKCSTSSRRDDNVLEDSVGGTPRRVLRQRLVEKDGTIAMMDSEFKELEEFTKLERQIGSSEKEEVIQELQKALERAEFEKKSFEERSVNFNNFMIQF